MVGTPANMFYVALGNDGHNNDVDGDGDDDDDDDVWYSLFTLSTKIYKLMIILMTYFCLGKAV